MTSTKAFRLGLIGHPVSHSKSPEIFREKFDREGLSNASYELFDLPTLDHFDVWIQQQANVDVPLIGFNVTVPHKTSVITYLTTISDEAKAIQAVNTVVISRNKIDQKIELHGHNTDVDGEFGECVRMCYHFDMGETEDGIFVKDLATGITHTHQGYTIKDVCTGLQKAIDEFTKEHPEWKVEKVFDNNHGLVVLSRMSQDTQGDD